jgi:uncharacterized protein
MVQALFRFYAELNDHLPNGQRWQTLPKTFGNPLTIRDALEAMDVPFDEVDLVLANGVSVGGDYAINDGDRLSIYPVFESFDISGLTRIPSRPLRRTRFILDTHLGKLAAHLRLFGFDSLYRNDYSDAELVAISNREARIILSRDRALLMQDSVTRGYRVRETDPCLQVKEVFHRFDLFNSAAPFQRCLQCNTLLHPVAKESILHRLPAKSSVLFEEFELCPGCDRIYWKGSHYARMQQFVGEVLRARESRTVSDGCNFH